MSVLNRVRKSFPNVSKVVDAKENIAVTVTHKDAAAGRKKDAANCALAKACTRQKIADGAIIGLGVSYLIKGKVATRYKTSVAVGREITSFDRHQDFAEGRDYLLSAIPKSMRINAKHRGGKSTTGTHHKRSVHRTEFVRKAKDA